MQLILDLQKLEATDAAAWFGHSCTSSMANCCNTERGSFFDDTESGVELAA